MSLLVVAFLAIFVIPLIGKLADAAEYERDDERDDGSWYPGQAEDDEIRSGRIT